MNSNSQIVSMLNLRTGDIRSRRRNDIIVFIFIPSGVKQAQ